MSTKKLNAEAAETQKSPARPITLNDLEVLPPVRRAAAGKPMPLPEIEEHIRALDAKIEDRTRGYHNEVIYDIVGKGLMLLKARGAHVATAGRPKKIGETVSPISGKALAKVEEQGEKGFLAWFEGKYPDQHIRTARNYMNAARNAGLTSDHALEDVEALKIAMALHEKKPTDLYRLADAVSDKPANTDPAPSPNLVQETQRDLFVYLDQVIVLREQMAPEEYEATHVRLHATLEKLTGAKWVMADEAPSADGAMHGELNGHKKAQKKAKHGTLTANDRARIAAQQKARWAKAKAKGARK